jgi:L-alanine-DL-glutamate epimerase-like enolase superfamily enzyme
VKITGVEAASLPESGRAVIELETDTGLTGLAIVDGAATAAVRALVRDRLAGADPRAAIGLWERMNGGPPGSFDGTAARARAALDIAMWDLKAKANDEPLWKTLGGARPDVPAHLSWKAPDRHKDAEWLRRVHAHTGIRSADLPASRDAAADLDAMAAARDALQAGGPGSSLMLRFDGTGWPGDVIRHVRKLEARFDLACVCSPVRSGDFHGARQVGDAIRAAVCIGRGFADVRAFLPYLRHYAANVIELDVATLGISGCIQMADAAFGFELPVLLAGYPGHVPVHLLPALATAMSVEIACRDWLDPELGHDMSFNAGRVAAGLRSGHGLTIVRPPAASGTRP